jgi:hypothetical protein
VDFAANWDFLFFSPFRTTMRSRDHLEECSIAFVCILDELARPRVVLVFFMLVVIVFGKCSSDVIGRWYLGAAIFFSGLFNACEGGVVFC